MAHEKISCFLCSREIGQDDAHVMLKSPKGDTVYAHSKHVGVDAEYDQQVKDK